jgi:CPA2 family monovalent cation:H+ antiporter-2
MDDFTLIVDLVMALGVAFLGGFAAQRLGLPVLIGYIAAGILIGPNTPGLVANHGNVEILANIGVAFLMFAIGVELSLEELNRVRRVALGSAAMQIPLTIALGFAVGLLIGWTWQEAALLGCGFSISSTIVAIKLSAAQGQLTSTHTHTALGIGVVQDLSLVPMMALLPVLQGGVDNIPQRLGTSLGVAVIVLVAVIVIGTTIAPRLLFAVARIESRELFLLTIVLIALGTAIVAEQAGLSLALGAFLAGLIVSESEFSSQALRLGRDAPRARVRARQRRDRAAPACHDDDRQDPHPGRRDARYGSQLPRLDPCRPAPRPDGRVQLRPHWCWTRRRHHR